MSKSLSIDLRNRVVDAIEKGLSRRQAAGRFGVSGSSAIRWHAQFRTAGHVTPQAQGGDRKSRRIEAEAEFIVQKLAGIKLKGISLAPAMAGPENAQQDE